jgi:hypothetical protein
MFEDPSLYIRRPQKKNSIASSAVGGNKDFASASSMQKESFSSEVIRFREDYNIYPIHDEVVRKIKEDAASEIVCDVFILGAKLALISAKTDGEKRAQERMLQSYEEEKRRKCNPQRLATYLEKSSILIKKYEAIPKSRNLVDVNNSDMNYYPTENDLKRIAVIKEFMSLVSNYIEIRYVCTGEKPSNIDTLCHECGRDLAPIAQNVRVIKYCHYCSYQCNIKLPLVKVPRSEIDESKPALTCNELNNFIKAINHYQGNIKPAQYEMEDVRAKLDEYFIAEGLPTGEQIKATRPLNSRGQREGTTVDMMHRAMKTKKIKCYDCINYVCREYWGWVLPDISHLEDVIISDYNKTQAVRSSLTVEERGGKSNIPVRLRLCEHLKKRGWNCDVEDFKLSTDYEKYLPGWKLMCERSGDPDLK